MEKWILCLHKGYVLNVIVPATSNKYRFHLKRPLLIKNDKDIEYFENDDNYVDADKPTLEDIEKEFEKTIEVKKVKKKVRKKKSKSNGVK